MDLDNFVIKDWIRDLVFTTEKMAPSLKYRIIFSSLKVIAEPTNHQIGRKISTQFSMLEEIARFFLVLIQSYKNRPAGHLISMEESEREMIQANSEAFDTIDSIEKEFIKWKKKKQTMKDLTIKLLR